MLFNDTAGGVDGKSINLDDHYVAMAMSSEERRELVKRVWDAAQAYDSFLNRNDKPVPDLDEFIQREGL